MSAIPEVRQCLDHDHPHCGAVAVRHPDHWLIVHPDHGVRRGDGNEVVHWHVLNDQHHEVIVDAEPAPKSVD